MLPGHASCMNNQSLQISRRIWCMTVEHNSEKAWFGGLLIKSAQNADELVSEIRGFTVVDNRKVLEVSRKLGYLKFWSIILSLVRRDSLVIDSFVRIV